MKKNKKKKILLTCAGGYGALNFIDSLIKKNTSYEFFGTHSHKYFLYRSNFRKNYLVPPAIQEKAYIQKTKKIINENKIDLIIPKSDIEVQMIGKHRKLLGCNVFLPDQKDIDNTQDKLNFYKLLKDTKVPLAKTFQIKKLKEVEKYISKIPKIEKKYWIRIKTAGTAGAYGASWVQNKNEVINWIQRCRRQSKIKISDFIISEFLPGRLFEILFLYKDGICIFGKVYENLKFLNSANAGNIGVGSSPELASSINDKLSMKALINGQLTILSIAKKLKTIPNGIYHMSLKENINKNPCVTEVNIGRTPSTINIFNNVGNINASKELLNCALGFKNKKHSKVFDLDSKKTLFIRSFDYKTTIIDIKNKI
mgnify:CR=1 FL=1